MNTWVVTITVVHTLLSIFALVLGFGVIDKLVRGLRATWMALFLGAASATTLTGFLFPFHGVTPAIIVGVAASFVLAVVFIARSRLKQSRFWMASYVSGVVASEYLLVFVSIAQAFTKVPFLHALAPTLKEAPFAVAQLTALVAFLVIGVFVVKKIKVRRMAFV